MKLVLVSILLCAAIYVASATKLLASSSSQLSRRETSLFKRLVKRQVYNGPKCNRRACAVPNCGKDFVAANLPGECCERCVPWEYPASLGIRYQPSQPQSQPQPQPQPQPYNSRVDVYIYGPEEGARVSDGQSIYFECEVIAPYNQYAQPRWSRAGNQPLPHKVQTTVLPGNRKLVRLSIPDATPSDGGRYECSAGTGNPSDQASIDLQVTQGGYYPQPQPQPQPQPADGNEGADVDGDDGEDADAGTTAAPKQVTTPAPAGQEEDGEGEGKYPEDQPHPHHPPQPQPADGNEDDDVDGDEDDEVDDNEGDDVDGNEGDDVDGDEGDDVDDNEGDDVDGDDGEDADAETTAAPKQVTTPAPADQEEGGEGEGKYPEDYTENEK